MPERDLVAAAFHRRIVQSSPPQLRAECAGTAFVAVLKDDFSDVRMDHGKVHADPLRKGLDPRGVHRLEPQIEHYGADLKIRIGKALIQLHRFHKQQGILAAGNADADLVAVLDHMVTFIRSADAAKNSLHPSVSASPAVSGRRSAVSII